MAGRGLEYCCMSRVLVVEDFLPFARGLARALRRNGFEVDVAFNCAQAKCSMGWYDAAIVDLELPDGTGLNVAFDLRADGRADEIVFFTACRDPQLLARAAQLGKVIDKDAGIPKLVAMLSYWLAVGEPQRVAVGAPSTRTPPRRGATRRSGTRRIRG